MFPAENGAEISEKRSSEMNRDNEENRGYGAENNGNAETENQRKAGGAGEEK